MTDDAQQDPQQDAQQDPQHDQVRRLLADARLTEPMPDEVTARLDGVLADLRADRPVRPGVADLAAARRRRRARGLLLAAAAVVVAGVGIDQLRGSGSPDSSAGGDSVVSGEAEHSQADDSAGARENARDGAASKAESPEAVPSAADLPRTELYVLPQAASRVAEEDFGPAALRIRERATRLRAADATDGIGAVTTRCRDQRWGPGRAVLIRYDGSPAALVYRPARGDTQVVDLFLCGRDEPARSITLPAP